MVKVALALVAVLLCTLAARADVPPPMRLWVEVDHPGPIHPQEMVLLRVHGRFMIRSRSRSSKIPAMEGFRTLRIDRDHWSERVRGRSDPNAPSSGSSPCFRSAAAS